MSNGVLNVPGWQQLCTRMWDVLAWQRMDQKENDFPDWHRDDDDDDDDDDNNKKQQPNIFFFCLSEKKNV